MSFTLGLCLREHTASSLQIARARGYTRGARRAPRRSTCARNRGAAALLSLSFPPLPSPFSSDGRAPRARGRRGLPAGRARARLTIDRRAVLAVLLLHFEEQKQQISSEVGRRSTIETHRALLRDD
mmetsp:Transcript_22343/g.70006  ORF Transcript_22343/g.70006 Transcript_22343/m.70006 type:complete len:126 (+) Transcript_22343:990-1367(+)